MGQNWTLDGSAGILLGQNPIGNHKFRQKWQIGGNFDSNGFKFYAC